MRALDAEDAVEPVEMIEIGRENAENFELEPAHLKNNRDEADGKHRSRGETVDGVLAQCDG